MNTDLTGKGMLDELAGALTALLSLMMESAFREIGARPGHWRHGCH